MSSKTWKHIIALALFAALKFQLEPAAQAQEETAGTAAQVSPQSDYTRHSVFWVAVTPLTPSTVSSGGSSGADVTAGFISERGW
jgi:Flp pilus assembly protein TadG